MVPGIGVECVCLSGTMLAKSGTVLGGCEHCHTMHDLPPTLIPYPSPNSTQTRTQIQIQTQTLSQPLFQPLSQTVIPTLTPTLTPTPIPTLALTAGLPGKTAEMVERHYLECYIKPGGPANPAAASSRGSKSKAKQIKQHSAGAALPVKMVRVLWNALAENQTRATKWC